MNLESIEYDEGSKEVFITFTDDIGNKRFELTLFSDEALQLCKMIQEGLKHTKQ